MRSANEVLRGVTELSEGRKIQEAQAVSDDQVKKLADMTDSNDHIGALVFIAKDILRDKRLTQAAQAFSTLRDFYNGFEGHLSAAYDDFRTKNIYVAMKRALSPEDYAKVSGAL